jgi:hypothetical protein
MHKIRNTLFFLNSKSTGCQRKLFSTSIQNNNEGLKTDGKWKQYCASLSTYFKLEEQGMKEFEMLSRASLFLVASQRIGFKKRLHLIGTAHVTHPWHFLDFFPEQKDWLKFVDEKSTKNVMEVRETKTGKTLTEFQLEQKTFKHPQLDLVVLHLKDEDQFWQKIKQKKENETESTNLLEIIPLSHTGMIENKV